MRNTMSQIGLSCAIFFVALSVATSQAQTNATCTFSLFQLSGTISNPQGNHANGVNSYGTVVGQGETSNNVEKGFVRYSGGGVSYWGNLNFSARNDNGVSVGSYVPAGSNTAEGFMLSGSTLTTIREPQSASPYGTNAAGINKFNSIVGSYTDSKGVVHGFKRLSNGSYVTLDYPGAQSTSASGINDSGTIVGSFNDATGSHGFIFSSGNWAKVDYPGTVGLTSLLGISNGNVILGRSTSTESGFTFIYANNVFKSIMDSKAAGGVFANGIAANGLITGDAYLQPTIGSWNGFLASCK